MNSIPSDYRPLKSTETLRKGDLYYHTRTPNIIEKMSYDSVCTAKSWPDYRIFRKRVRPVKPAPVVAPVLKAAVIKHDKTVTKTKDKKTVVSFVYPNRRYSGYSERTVQLIALNAIYVTGLEITNPADDTHYQFKKFLRSKIPHNRIEIVSYGE